MHFFLCFLFFVCFVLVRMHLMVFLRIKHRWSSNWTSNADQRKLMLGGASPPTDPPSGFAAAASPQRLRRRLRYQLIIQPSTLHPCPPRCIRALLQTLKKTSKTCSPTIVRTTIKMKRHFSAHSAERPRTCPHNDPIRKNVGTFCEESSKTICVCQTYVSVCLTDVS